MENNENNQNEYTEEVEELVEEKAESQKPGRGKTLAIIAAAVGAVVVLAVGVIIGITLAGSGNQTEVPTHTHAFGEWETVTDADCTVDGEKVRFCDCGEKQSEVIYASHTEVVEKAVEATCQSKGLTEGRYCSVCGEVLAVQTVTNLSDHKYDNDKDANCNVCGKLRDVSCKHPRTETVKGHSATCITDGLSDGEKCLDCGEMAIKQTVIKAGHTVVIDEEIPASCISTGLTEGSHCSECGYIIKAQQVTDITPHIFSDGEYIEYDKVYDTTHKDIKAFADLPFVCENETFGLVSCHYCKALISLRVNVVHEYDKNGVCTKCGEHN